MMVGQSGGRVKLGRISTGIQNSTRHDPLRIRQLFIGEIAKWLSISELSLSFETELGTELNTALDIQRSVT